MEVEGRGGDSPVNGLTVAAATPANGAGARPLVPHAPASSGTPSAASLKTQVLAWHRVIEVAEKEIERKGRELSEAKTRIRAVEWDALTRAREASVLSDRLKAAELKLAERDKQVRALLANAGFSASADDVASTDALVAAAVDDRVTFERKFISAQSELSLKTRYLEDKEAFWSQEMAALESKLSEQSETVDALRAQLQELRKVQESGSMAAYGRQSAALKERATLRKHNGDLTKKLTEASSAIQSQRAVLTDLQTELKGARAQIGVFTRNLLPLLEDAGLFLNSTDAQAISDGLRAVVDAMAVELRHAGRDIDRQTIKAGKLGVSLSMSSTAAQQLLSLKEATVQSQHNQTALLAELETTAENLTRAIVDLQSEPSLGASGLGSEADALGELLASPRPPGRGRSFSLEQEMAATRIQSIFRGHEARKARRAQGAASCVIQKHYRRYRDVKKARREKEGAARVIQAGVRGWKTRKQMQKGKLKFASVYQDQFARRAAVKLQAYERGRQGRKKARQRREEQESATVIQKHVRARKARNILREKRKDAPGVADFGVFVADGSGGPVCLGTVVKACGRPSNGTDVCMFQWVRKAAAASLDDGK